MTKAELVETIAGQTKLTKKDAAKLINLVFSNIGKAVRKDARFSYPGFGTWSLRRTGCTTKSVQGPNAASSSRDRRRSNRRPGNRLRNVA